MIDINLLHGYYTRGEKISVIARKFGVSEDEIRRTIRREQKFNPDIWPNRDRRMKHAKRIQFYTTHLAKMMRVHPAKRTDRWDRRMSRLQAYKRCMDNQLPDPREILR